MNEWTDRWAAFPGVSGVSGDGGFPLCLLVLTWQGFHELKPHFNLLRNVIFARVGLDYGFWLRNYTQKW